MRMKSNEGWPTPKKKKTNLGEAWRERLRELGCDPDEQCYQREYNHLVADFQEGKKVFVLVDARPALDDMPPILTFWPADGNYRHMLECVAVLDPKK